jgi:uncharacterized damage-inducible protein DinB
MSSSTPLPDGNYSPTWPDGSRTKPPLLAGELELLTSYLDYYRATIELKCAGVPKERLSEAVVPPSTLTLHGLVRHLAGVEEWWFHHQFAGAEWSQLYYSDDDPDQDFDDLSGDFDEALATWRAMCQRSRQIVADASSLDQTGTRHGTGEQFSLRRLMLHMIVEYSRHCGHVDLLRERIDGATGA